MSIIKTTSSWADSFDQPGVQIVNLSSRGLRGDDYRDFVKRASADILHDIDSIREKVASDETLVHMLAIGATEDYGANRNGDGFRRKTCQQYHPTFVKYAMFYRNHENKDPRKSYGRIIKSAWNDPMRRIELLVALNNNEEAARRNKGLVADRELEKLASGKDIPVSMACKVAYDVCSYCGNESPTTNDYCRGTHQGGMCKAGGLKDNIGALVEIDGGIHQLHADNPHPSFFDISHVFRPADRIAYVTGALVKSANADGRIIKSADIARQLGVVVPYELAINSGDQPRQVQHLLKIAYHLSQLESDIAAGKPPVSSAMAAAFKPCVQDGDHAMPVPPMVREKFALAMRALADQKICLPLSRFMELTVDQPFEKSAELAVIVARELPGVFTRLLSDSNVADRIKASQYTPSDAAAPPVFALWSQKLAAAMSLQDSHVQRRVVRAALQLETGDIRRASSHEKSAGSRDSVGRLAEEYALYQLAFLGAIPTEDPSSALTHSLSVVQNYAL